MKNIDLNLIIIYIFFFFRFGAKAELRWSFSVQKHADDAFKDIKRTLYFQQEFSKLAHIWEQDKFK